MNNENNEKEKLTDLLSDGPGSPISLLKFNESQAEKDNPNKLKVLIDNSGNGIIFDDPSVLVMTSEDRIEQAYWTLKNHLPINNLPPYLLGYLALMFEEEVDALGSIEAKEHFLLNKIKYCASNKESAQIIGLIILFVETVKLAQMNNFNAPTLLIDKPETDLHPKREARIMTLINKMREDLNV